MGRRKERALGQFDLKSARFDIFDDAALGLAVEKGDAFDFLHIFTAVGFLETKAEAETVFGLPGRHLSDALDLMGLAEFEAHINLGADRPGIALIAELVGHDAAHP